MARNDIGVMNPLSKEGPFFRNTLDFGIDTCQLNSGDEQLWLPELADQVKREIRDTGVHVTSFWAGLPGPQTWDFVGGPATLGIVPEKYRKERVRVLKKAGDFAHRLGLPAVITHLGFIPENADDPVFAEVVEVVRDIALHLDNLGLEFWFETGQETPITMLRLIHAVGTGNLGLNLDPANLILYGKANPIDALDVFGSYVRNIHAKDGLYPTDPMKLGREVKVGEGKVRFPEFVRRLEELGFQGEYIIEREITGAEQNADIRATIGYLRSLLTDE